MRLVVTRLYDRCWRYRATVHQEGCHRIPRRAKLFPFTGTEPFSCPHCIRHPSAH